MAPAPRCERSELSSRLCSTSWKFGPSPRRDGDREPLLQENVELADLHGARVVKIPGGAHHQDQPTPLILHNDSLVGFGVLLRQLLPPELPRHGVQLLLARLEERDPYHRPMVPAGRAGVTQRVICFGLFAVLVDGDTRTHATCALFAKKARADPTLGRKAIASPRTAVRIPTRNRTH